MGGGVALLAGLGALYIPDGEVAVAAPEGHRRFTWGEDDLFVRLERDFDRARRSDCARSEAAIDAGLAGLDSTLGDVEAHALGADAPILSTLEGQLFEVAPLFGACPSRVPELAARTSRLRAAVKDRSSAWNLDERGARDRLYRLLYGSRAVLEELLLAQPEAASREGDTPGLVLGTAEPSQTPSVRFHGVTLHSGDILLSRGGAPTSALIARGNDYPGNFSHVALLHVSEEGTPTVIESHIESGGGATPAERYLEDTKLRIMVLRVRSDLPALRADPLLPHHAASEALARITSEHVPYDFEMNWRDPSALFCSEVASAAYAQHDVHLWRNLSSMSGRGLTRWLSSVGVRYFETHSPSDVEYDPQVRVVAEWRDPDTLFSDHIDNAVLDVLIEGAERGDELGYDRARLPVARLAKGYSWVLGLFGSLGPIPEGMSATTGLRVEQLRVLHHSVRARLERRVAAYRRAHHRRPPYWELLRLAADAKREADRGRA